MVTISNFDTLLKLASLNKTDKRLQVIYYNRANATAGMVRVVLDVNNFHVFSEQ